MDRRVLLLAEPAPLICFGVNLNISGTRVLADDNGKKVVSSAAADAAAEGQRRYHHHASSRSLPIDAYRLNHLVADLRHLRRVLDDISISCCHYQSNSVVTAVMTSQSVSDKQNSKGAQRRLSSGHDGVGLRSGGWHGRRVLLAAVFPCPEIDPSFFNSTLEGDSDDHDCGGVDVNRLFMLQKLLPQLSNMLANVLDACGTWLSPADFEERLLAPTKVLVEKQLDILLKMTTAGHEDTLHNASTVSASTSGVENDGRNVVDTCEDEKTKKRLRAESGDEGADRAYSNGVAVRCEAEMEVEPEGANANPAQSPPSPSLLSGKRPKLDAPGDGDIDVSSPRRAHLSSSKPSSALLRVPPFGAANLTARLSTNRPLASVMVAPAAATKAAVAASAAFIQDAGEEILFLVQAALCGESNPASKQPTVSEAVGAAAEAAAMGSQTTAQAKTTSRRSLFDILWAPSYLSPESERENINSCAAEQGGDAAEDVKPSGSSETSTSGAAAVAMAIGSPEESVLDSAAEEADVRRLPSTPSACPMPLTLSVQHGDPRALPLREALQAARSAFPNDSCVTIWPAGCGEPGGGPTAAPSPQTLVAEALRGKGDVADTNAEGEAEECSLMECQEPLTMAATERALREDWLGWCNSVGAIFFCSPWSECNRGHGGASDATTADRCGKAAMLSRPQPVDANIIPTVTPVDPGLLWRGPIVPAATLLGSEPRCPASLSPTRAPACSSVGRTLPRLEGFALRTFTTVAAANDTARRRREVASTSNGLGMEMATTSALGCAAVEALAGSSGLRLARVLTRAAVAGACHLLADGAVAPPLELFVFDTCRFPGSAAFLQEWAADGRGMLLVAAKEEDEEHGGVGRGLAMVCCPQWRNFRGNTGHGILGGGGAERRNTSAAMWSVTLFRRPSEFAEAGVAALVGESFPGADRCLFAGSAESDSKRGTAVVVAPAAGRDGSTSQPTTLASVPVGDATTPSFSASSSYGRSGRGGRKGSKNGRGAKGGKAVIAGDFGSNEGQFIMAHALAALPRYTAESLQREVAFLRDPDSRHALLPGKEGCGGTMVGAGSATSSKQAKPHSAPSRRQPRRQAAVAAEEKRNRSANDTDKNVEFSVQSKASQTKNKKLRTAEGWKGSSVKCELAAAESEEAVPLMDTLNAIMDARSAWLDQQDAAVARCKLPTAAPRSASATTISATTSSASTFDDDANYGKGNSVHGTTSSISTAAGTSITADSLYASFGSWGRDGCNRWAEEFMLPFGDEDISGEISTRLGADAGVVGVFIDGRGGEGRHGAKERINATTATPTRATTATATAIDTALAPLSAMPQGTTMAIQRVLSTAEQALEKAGQQQRQRVKERRLVAREQRARMERPRPRPRPSAGSRTGIGIGSDGSSGGAKRNAGSSGASGATATTGNGPVVFRRRGSSGTPLLPPPPTTTSLTGRSASTAKLSRGSLILGRSVEATAPGGSSGDGGCDGDGTSGSGKEKDVRVPIATARAGSTTEQRESSGSFGLLESRREPKMPISQNLSSLSRQQQRQPQQQHQQQQQMQQSRSKPPQRVEPRPETTTTPTGATAVGTSPITARNAGRVRRAIFLQQEASPPKTPALTPPPTSTITTTTLAATAATAPPPRTNLLVPTSLLSPLPAAEAQKASAHACRKDEAMSARRDPLLATAGMKAAGALGGAAVLRADAGANEEIARGPAKGTVTSGGAGAGVALGGQEHEAGNGGAVAPGNGVLGGNLGNSSSSNNSSSIVGGGSSGSDGNSTMRRVMELAMLSAIASQMGLEQGDSRVREVFERESRIMAGSSAMAGSTGGDADANPGR